MKQKTVIALLVGAALAAALVVSLAGHKTVKNKTPKIGDTGSGVGTEKMDLESYEVDFGDYILEFDYLPGFADLGLMSVGTIQTEDFGQGTTMITATCVPAEYNQYSTLPRTAEEYLDYVSDAAFLDALPYDGGDAEGYVYWERTEYEYGTGFVNGYNLFCEDGTYIYIFIQRMDQWPDNLQNVRVVKK